MAGPGLTWRIDPVGEDCTPLVALRRSWHPGDEESFASRFAAWWAVERVQRHALVAWSTSGEPVGMANGQLFARMPVPDRPPVRWMYGANVFVLPSYRRQGVGRSLMTALIEFASAEGLSRIVLAPSEESVPLYRSLGFRVADDLMRLDLPG